MADTFYTTHDLQGLLHVDRTTIYRMAEAGRLPAVKVGHQWRFPRRLVDRWLADSGAAPAPHNRALGAAPQPAPESGQLHLRQVLPVECAQLMQDTFADALGVSILMTDMLGEQITRTSNPCGYLAAVEAHPHAAARCLSGWAEVARRLTLQPDFLPSPMGLLCASAFFRAGSELMGMVIFAGLTPAVWPPAAERLTQIAEHLEMEPTALEGHLHEVFAPDAERRQQLLHFAQRLADIVTHIISERRQVRTTLADIAALTTL